jgi:chitodextrinase
MQTVPENQPKIATKKNRLKALISSRYTVASLFVLVFAAIGAYIMFAGQAATIVMTQQSGSWSDPAVWDSEEIPGPNDRPVIEAGHEVLYDIETSEVAGMIIEEGATVRFSPSQSVQLDTTDNIIVSGRLELQPNSFDVEHFIRFVDIDEDDYVGAAWLESEDQLHEHGHPVDTDTGLWIIDNGVFDAVGSERLSWTRASGGLSRGDTSIELQDLPAGWQTGDEILITPTSSPGTDGFHDGYSGGHITSIAGNTIELDTPLAYNHPMVNNQWTAEVMNMTRNVRIEGTPEGRAHTMFLHVHNPQKIKNVSYRHMGPRQDTDDSYTSGGERVPITQGVNGRYPLHMHMSYDGTRGSVIENVVSRDSGHKGFVVHASHGVEVEGTIAHNVMDDAYWWDKAMGGECCGSNRIYSPPSNDVTYNRAIASLVKTDPPFRGYTLAGFDLGHGENVAVTNSVAVGVQGNSGASGFFWPGGVDASIDHWHFENNIGHNNKVHGIHVWDNHGRPLHFVDASVFYHNGVGGINHGAYGNNYKYNDLILYANGESGFRAHAQGYIPLTDMIFDGGGVSQYGFRTNRHRSVPAADDRSIGNGYRLVNPTFRGYTDYAVAFRSGDKSVASVVDVIYPTFDGPESTWFHLSDDTKPDSIIRVQLDDDTAFRLHPASSDTGLLIPEWNARQEMIEPFADDPPFVAFTNPLDGEVVSGVVTLTVDPDDSVDDVRYYLAGDLLTRARSAPFDSEWDTTEYEDGEYTLNIRANDRDRDFSTYGENVVITVNNSGTISDPDPEPEPEEDTEPPTQPTNLRTTSKTHESVSMTWEQSTDNVGVDGYEVLRDDTVIATVEDASYTDTGLAASTEYRYNVRAFDAAGNVSELSSTLTVTTEAVPDTEAPVVSITNPGDGALVAETVSVTASATDNVGVTYVEFLLDGTVVSTDSSSPYSYSWDTTELDDGDYTLRARAYDAAGNVGTSDPVTVTVQNEPEEDTEPPTTPENLEAVTVEHNQVELSWDPSTDNVGVAGYRVYRNGTWLATTSTVGYTDTSVSEEATYTYTVVAFDAAGNSSDASNEVEITTPASPDTEPPTAPELSAEVTSSAAILSWTESTDNVGVAGYYVQRDGYTIATVTETTYTDSNVSHDTTYTYRVVAFDEAGNWAASNTVTITTDPNPDADTEPPSTPTNLRETYSHTQNIDMAWDPSTDNVGVAGYHVYRDGDLLATVSNVSTTSFGDYTVRPNTDYRYNVQAVDTSGNTSDLSNDLDAFSHRRR